MARLETIIPGSRELPDRLMPPLADDPGANPDSGDLENALHAREWQLRQALAAAAACTWDWDPATGAILCAGRTERIFGTACDEFHGLDAFLRRIHPEDACGLESALHRARRDLGQLHHPLRILWADGSYHRAFLRVQFLGGHARAPVASGILQAVLESDREAILLDESRRRFQFLAETLPLIVWIAGPDGTNEYFNHRWFDYTGRRPEETRGTSWADQIHPEDRESTLLAWERAVESGSSYRADYRLRRGFDGAWRWHHAQALPLRGSGGRILHWFGFIQDIDDRKVAEEALKDAYAELEDRIAQRTAELEAANRRLTLEVRERAAAEDELVRQARELILSNTELQQFAYVASHDLQEPLRNVTMSAQLLDRTCADRLDGDAREYLGFIVDGAARMQRLIQDLLDYSRIGHRGGPCRVESQKALAEAVGNLRQSISESDAQITWDPLPKVAADPLRLVQLFQNILSNAIKFRREERPVIHVSARRSAREWVFTVRDNGIGIDPDHVERIFVIFQRLNEPGRFAGSGIGLSICKKIVDQIGGRIWVKSQPGEGSSFHFSIPIEQGASLPRTRTRDLDAPGALPQLPETKSFRSASGHAIARTREEASPRHPSPPSGERR